MSSFPLRDLAADCELVFSLTLLSGRAKLFVRDPTSYPMKVMEAQNGLVHISKDARGQAVYLVEVVGYSPLQPWPALSPPQPP